MILSGICIWTWNFGCLFCLFDMNIADYDSHNSIDNLVSGTKTDDLESPCLSTCWSWLHVHQWLDFDSSTSDSDSTDTNLGLNVSDVCMNVYDLDSIKHVISITFDLPVVLNMIIEDLDCHSQSRTRLTNSDRNSHEGTEIVWFTRLYYNEARYWHLTVKEHWWQCCLISCLGLGLHFKTSVLDLVWILLS